MLYNCSHIQNELSISADKCHHGKTDGIMLLANCSSVQYGVIIEFFENSLLILIDGVANLTVGTDRYRHCHLSTIAPFFRISTKAANSVRYRYTFESNTHHVHIIFQFVDNDVCSLTNVLFAVEQLGITSKRFTFDLRSSEL